jgi:hypothetical protein
VITRKKATKAVVKTTEAHVKLLRKALHKDSSVIKWQLENSLGEITEALEDLKIAIADSRAEATKNRPKYDSKKCQQHTST